MRKGATVRSALIGIVLLVIGGVLVLTGVLPVDEAVAVADRVWPILLFVVAITIVTELAADAGLFVVIAERMTRLGLHRAWVLWLLVVLLASASTIFLSLDTTAVLLTPVVVVLARHAGLPPLPFALTTVWLANTASLLLPVSNLTNLLAEGEIGVRDPLAFAALMFAPAIVCIVVPALVLFVVFRRSLLRGFDFGSSTQVADRVLLIASGVVVGLLVPALVSGLPVWIPSLVAAIVLGAFFAVRRRRTLRFSLLPWQLVLLASGLFLVIEAGHAVGMTTVLASVAGTGGSLPELLRLTGVGAASANIVNNLPAYLALEPVAGSPVRLAALLIGVNAGPLVTPWASLATLLWHQRLEALDVPISWGRYMVLGVIVVPVTIVPAVVALYLTY